MEKLLKEYFEWLYANLPLWYIEDGDLCADSVLCDSLDGGQLDLNSEQQGWLRNFIERWDSMKRKELP